MRGETGGTGMQKVLPSITWHDLEKRESGDTAALVVPVCKKSYQEPLGMIWKNVKKVAGPLDEATPGEASERSRTGMQNVYQASLVRRKTFDKSHFYRFGKT